MTREEWTRVYNTRGFEGALLFGRSLPFSLSLRRGEDGGDDAAFARPVGTRFAPGSFVAPGAPAPFSFSFSFPISISISFSFTRLVATASAASSIFPTPPRRSAWPSSPSRGRIGDCARLPRNPLPRLLRPLELPAEHREREAPARLRHGVLEGAPAARDARERDAPQTPHVDALVGVARLGASHSSGALNGAVHPAAASSCSATASWRLRTWTRAGRAEPKSISTARSNFFVPRDDPRDRARAGSLGSRVSRRTFPGLRSRWA